MKKKQLWGIIITGFVIIAVGVTGVLGNVVNSMLLEEQEETLSSMWDVEMSNEIVLPTEDFIGVIDVVGEIGPSSTSSIYLTETGYNHSLYMDFIDQMMYADNNKGIMLYIDSPGGTVYEADELYLKLMEYKDVTDRPVYAYFGSQACSGGYYIAMAADTIYANRNSWTGSIGVIISYMNSKGLYDKLGIEEINITSGENKAMGSSGVDLTAEQYEIFQSLVDEAYDQFVDIICTGRNMSESTVRTLADGRIYSAKQALENGLIDAIGSYEETQEVFAETEGFSSYITYYAPESASSQFMSFIFGAINELKPQSDTELATDILENNGNGVLKYYAE